MAVRLSGAFYCSALAMQQPAGPVLEGVRLPWPPQTLTVHAPATTRAPIRIQHQRKFLCHAQKKTRPLPSGGEAASHISGEPRAYAPHHKSAECICKRIHFEPPAAAPPAKAGHYATCPARWRCRAVLIDGTFATHRAPANCLRAVYCASQSAAQYQFSAVRAYKG